MKLPTITQLRQWTAAIDETWFSTVTVVRCDSCQAAVVAATATDNDDRILDSVGAMFFDGETICDDCLDRGPLHDLTLHAAGLIDPEANVAHTIRMLRWGYAS